MWISSFSMFSCSMWIVNACNFQTNWFWALYWILWFSGFSHFSIFTFIVEHWTWNKSIRFSYVLWKTVCFIACTDGVRAVWSMGDGWLLGLCEFFSSFILSSFFSYFPLWTKGIIKSERNPFQKIACKRSRQGMWHVYI